MDRLIAVTGEHLGHESFACGPAPVDNLAQGSHHGQETSLGVLRDCRAYA